MRPSALVDFCVFRIMLAPVIVQIAFWMGVVGSIVVGAYFLLEGFAMPMGTRAERSSALESIFGGLAFVLLGPIVVRLYCEVHILFFRMNETLTQMLHELEKQNRRR